MGAFFYLSDIYKSQMIVSENSRNAKKNQRLNSVKRTQRFTKPFQSLGYANIVINTQNAIPKLHQLSQKYIGVNDPYGFSTNLHNVLEYLIQHEQVSTEKFKFLTLMIAMKMSLRIGLSLLCAPPPFCGRLSIGSKSFVYIWVIILFRHDIVSLSLKFI